MTEGHLTGSLYFPAPLVTGLTSFAGRPHCYLVLGTSLLLLRKTELAGDDIGLNMICRVGSGGMAEAQSLGAQLDSCCWVAGRPGFLQGPVGDAGSSLGPWERRKPLLDYKVEETGSQREAQFLVCHNSVSWTSPLVTCIRIHDSHSCWRQEGKVPTRRTIYGLSN